MNKVILSGNICKDIEIRYTSSNQAVIQNTIAVKNNFKNTEGKYESQFFNFIAWSSNAEILNKYAEKGSKILIDGRLSTRNYQREDGQKVYITEVIVDRIEILTFKKGIEVNKTNYTNEESQEESDIQNDPFKEFGKQIELEEYELPFE